MEVSKKDMTYFLACGIKTGWHTKRLSDYSNDKEAHRIVLKYMKSLRKFKEDGIGLYLWGSNGTGKSHLLNTAFMEIIKIERMTSRVYSFDELVDLYTSSWRSNEQKAEVERLLRDVDFLGIDEFGKNLGSTGEPMPIPDFMKRIMESVIRYRVQMKKPIWICSNTDPKYLREVFSEDIASLLNEAVVAVSVKGDDFRKKIYKENNKRFI